MIAEISVNAYLFLAFLDLTCHFEDTEIGAFGCTVPPDSKETKLGSSISTGLVLVSCSV